MSMSMSMSRLAPKWLALVIACVSCLSSAGTTSAEAAGGAWAAPNGIPTLKFIHLFKASGLYFPEAELTEGPDGLLYGTTDFDSRNGDGGVFGIKPSGHEFSAIHFFDGHDGSSPNALAVGSDGAFYGTTLLGGKYSDPHANVSGGVAFKLSASGQFTLLHAFGGPKDDGTGPAYIRLVQAPDGFFYGATELGGANNGGTLFKMSAAGKVTKLHDFVGQSGTTDGSFPTGGLVLATDGYLYGQTVTGGTYSSGVIYRISTGGDYGVVYEFGGPPDDLVYPESHLTQGSDGMLYGVATLGGAYQFGAIFRMPPGGQPEIFYSFTPAEFMGGEGFPNPVILASDGFVYGTSLYGGPLGLGMVYRVSPHGKFQMIYFFGQDDTQTAYPAAGLIQASNGNLYGVAAGGALGWGGVFEVRLPH
jgi:uncharacterized repeat protein (TIGR03803 family)